MSRGHGYQGYLINTDVMQELWDRAFSPSVVGVVPKDCSLCVTEALLTPAKLQANLVDLAFNYYGFQSLYVTSAPQLAHYGAMVDLAAEDGAAQPSENASPAPRPQPPLHAPCGSIIVDSGYSFSHVAPVLNGHVLNYAVKRQSVGGRLLTNHLKEMVRIPIRARTLLLSSARSSVSSSPSFWERPRVDFSL